LSFAEKASSVCFTHSLPKLGRGLHLRTAVRSPQEINASQDEPLACVVVRNDQEPIVVNLDIPSAESPEQVHWVDHIHPHP
jgi:uncharacterized RmlC-like cupin family protein